MVLVSCFSMMIDIVEDDDNMENIVVEELDVTNSLHNNNVSHNAGASEFESPQLVPETQGLNDHMTT